MTLRITGILAAAAIGVACTPWSDASLDPSPEATSVPSPRALVPHGTARELASGENWSRTDGFTVHEWGTFTAVSNQYGELMHWRPLIGPSDLPDFVHTEAGAEQEHARSNKGHTPAPIRMETPVLYFYNDGPMTASAKVSVENGIMTEWYPEAAHADVRSIDWGEFEIVPGGDRSVLPSDGSLSHYYPARETDAAILHRQVGRDVQHEAFLFYRGLGFFDLALRAAYRGGEIKLDAGREDVGRALVFVNDGGRIGYTVVEEAARTRVALPPMNTSQEDVERELERMLVDTGLYRPEAKAMIATWHDYWFEEGVRVLYLLHPEEVAQRLPLEIDPPPAGLVRTIVGRIELLTPARVDRVGEIIERAQSPENACRELRATHGRFAEPLVWDLIDRGGTADRLARVGQTLECLRRVP